MDHIKELSDLTISPYLNREIYDKASDKYEVYKLAETLGGFIVEQAGKILKKNESIEVGNLELIVEASDKKKIKMVKAVIKEVEE